MIERAVFYFLKHASVLTFDTSMKSSSPSSERLAKANLNVSAIR